MNAILSVFRHHQAGWHAYTSPQVPGLFLSGPDEDAQAVAEALPSTIRDLIQAADGRAACVRQVDSYRGSAAPEDETNKKDVLHFLITSVPPGVPETEAHPLARKNGTTAHHPNGQD